MYVKEQKTKQNGEPTKVGSIQMFFYLCAKDRHLLTALDRTYVYFMAKTIR